MGRKPLSVENLGESVARILSEEIARRGWSQRRAAEETGITRTRLVSIMTAERPATIDELDDIARAVDTTVTDIISEAQRHIRRSSLSVAPDSLSPEDIDEIALRSAANQGTLEDDPDAP